MPLPTCGGSCGLLRRDAGPRAPERPGHEGQRWAEHAVYRVWREAECIRSVEVNVRVPGPAMGIVFEVVTIHFGIPKIGTIMNGMSI